MLARVELTFDVPLSKRGYGVVVGKLSVGKLDVRDAWEEMPTRLIICHNCGAPHEYEVATKELKLEKGWQ
jgi:hypothetical protein